jgi:outer membrane biosynthesis protein TonB
MPAAVGPRFVLEAGFLVLLAVVVGFADLSPALIVLVMALGWALVSLIEYFAWRQTQALALSGFEGPPPSVVEEEEVIAPPPPPPAPPPPPQPAAEEETMVEPPAAEPPAAEAEAQPETEPSPEAAPTPEAEPAAFQAAPERRVGHRLEPLQPRPRRRWILFGPHERRPEPPAEGDREEES